MDFARAKSTRNLVGALLLTVLAGCHSAQPQAPVTTVWEKMGIPQAHAALTDGLTNAKGNHPGLERKPPLLRLADAKNLVSKVPAIKAAAVIKAEEDLKPQKIKSLKYLASVGCGCYNAGGVIEAAFLDALKDCNPEVREAAANAIAEAAGNGCSDGCTPSCCGAAIQKRLKEMASGEKDGCWIEPSDKVRAAATNALTACPAIAVPERAVPEKPTPTKSGYYSPLNPYTKSITYSPIRKPATAYAKPRARIRKSAPIVNAIARPKRKVQTAKVQTATAPRVRISVQQKVKVAKKAVAKPAATVANPQHLVHAKLREYDAKKRVLKFRLHQQYQIPKGAELLLRLTNGASVLGKITWTDGSQVTLKVSSGKDEHIKRSIGHKVGVGQIAR